MGNISSFKKTAMFSSGIPTGIAMSLHFVDKLEEEPVQTRQWLLLHHTDKQMWESRETAVLREEKQKTSRVGTGVGSKLSRECGLANRRCGAGHRQVTKD